MRACFELSCTLRGNAPIRRSVDTCTAGANTTDLLLDVVVSPLVRCSAPVLLFRRWSLPAGPGIVLPVTRMSPLLWLRISPLPIGAAVVVVAIAVQGASIADDPVAGCDLDHRRGAWLSICRGGHAHGLHLQPRLSHHPHGQRLARGLWQSSFGPTGSAPPEPSHFPGLSNQVNISLRTNKPQREIGELGRPVLYVSSRGRVMSRGVLPVSSKSRAHERNIQRQAHLLLCRMTRTFFLLCRRLLLVFRQQF